MHKSFFCCGREVKVKPERKSHSQHFGRGEAVRIVKDEHHPRGFREICSKPELRRRKHKMMASGQYDDCYYCHETLKTSEYSDIELAHKEPKGMGGARHDDHPDNLALAHRVCNRENGSKRPAA